MKIKVINEFGNEIEVESYTDNRKNKDVNKKEKHNG